MNNFKPIPVGISDYKKAIEEDYYIIDKTGLIKEILDDKPEVFLVPRPRRFGKTLTMSMVKYYFDNTETNAEEYFKDKDIWRAGERYQKEMSQYPVIFFTFKDVKNNNWNDTFDGLKIVIMAEYQRHKRELIDTLEEEEQAYYLKICSGEGSMIEYQTSLKTLTLFLRRKYQKSVILLIDEYDIPIQQGYVCSFYDDVITFMRNFLSGGLKDNPYLKFAFLTGILRVAKESIFSGLNNLEVYSCLEERYSSYFGFTNDEVRKIAEDYNCNKLSEIKEWYNGYLFGSLEIYNPWSVLRYIKNNFQAEAYWIATSTNDIITELIENATDEVEKKLRQLLTGKIYSDIDTDIIYPTIHDNTKSIFSFLVMTGYLKAEKHFIDDHDYDYELCLPNREITIAYRDEIVKKMNENYTGAFETYARTFKRAVLNDDSETVDELLRKIAEYTISYHDAHENFYHGWMLSTTALFLDSHISRSNQETGDGRFDLMLIPRTPKYPGVIFEFKVVQDGSNIENRLKEKAMEAYAQINEKSYDAELKSRGVTDIKKYGIAFCKKQLAVYNGK